MKDYNNPPKLYHDYCIISGLELWRDNFDRSKYGEMSLNEIMQELLSMYGGSDEASVINALLDLYYRDCRK